MSTTPKTSATRNATASPTPTLPVSRDTPPASTIAPETMSTTCQIRTSRTDTSTCESSGFVSVKSSFPSRTSSMRRVMLGWIQVRMSPPMRIWMPKTHRSSGCVQPFSSAVCEYTSASTTRPVTSAIAICSSETKKFTRYWSSFSTPSFRYSQLTRTEFTLSPHRGVMLDGDAPRHAEDAEPDQDPEELRAKPFQELGAGQVADEAVDREVEGVLERKEARDLLHPVGHERHGHETTGEEQLGGHV